MFEYVSGVLYASINILNRMSPYLLFGFLFAGLLHIFISIDTIANHLGKRGLKSVVKSVILGIPLPLCSCGVIPAAVALDKKGASKGAVVSFLIATPITGIDSILATYSLLGLFFAIFRVIASSVTAIAAGILTNIFHPEKLSGSPSVTGHEDEICAVCDEHHCCEEMPTKHKLLEKIKALFSYAFVELLGDIWKWLLIGIIIAGVIEYSIPEAFIQTHLGSAWTAMPLMLLVGIPMYVCATGSIPIAASLMLKGLSPGAALVFLLAGPATNAVTITVVSKEIGKLAAFLYVITVAMMSIIMGILLNHVWYRMGMIAPRFLEPMEMIPSWMNIASSIILGTLILINRCLKLFQGSQK